MWVESIHNTVRANMTGFSDHGISAIPARLATVRERVAKAAAAAGRDPASVRILGVTKLQPVEAIQAALAAGLEDVGENFVQEALEKMDTLGSVPARWHFIGALQSNKTAAVAGRFDWVQSVDRLKLAERLSRQRPTGRPPLNVCIQVRIGDESSKSGIAPAGAAELACRVADLPGLKLRGLMAVPPPESEPTRQRGWFRQLARLYDKLRSGGIELDTLSMGMSADLEAAIAEGATLVRIGTAIFGYRDQRRRTEMRS
jgi:PLP dependent protein